MSESYPHKIKKTKITILGSLVFLFFFGIFVLRNSMAFHFLNERHLLNLHILQYFLLAALFSFSLKMFIIQNSRENLYLFLGAVSFLFFQIFYIYFIKAQAALEAQFTLQQNFEQVGSFIFYLFLFIAIFSSKRIIPARQRNKRIILTLAISISINASFIALLLCFFPRQFSINQLNFQTVDVIAVLGALLLICASTKAIRNYIQSQHNLYYWQLFSLVLFFFSAVYFLPNQNKHDGWIETSLALQLAGLALLIWTFFLENTRFLEGEIDVRNNLEDSLLQSENELKLLNETFNGLGVGICVLDKNGSLKIGRAHV